MSTESKIVTALSSLVSGRVYPDFAPSGAAFPYIVYQQVGGTATTFLDKAVPSMRNGRFQIEAWAKTRSEAVGLAMAIESAMTVCAEFEAKPMTAHISDAVEELALYGSIQDFSVWDAR